ncbi:MAG TPA: helix-turn-helix transcriptional regulator [Candidatus Gallacutalibacter pullicola]|uniref:Helix-turn-helix transcriptional regulator n=1 Tax=Candidatus Gallacutalibacter pullicola TaxID=2840830 RepID=A0A9D1DPS3_9FIRM|nr:helix-turn-helix transcriptional regulator [Candidatus Gallacutalibacter pullicola]
MGSKRYELGLRKGDCVRANLLYVTSARYGKDWHSMLHVHSCTELFFVTRGHGSFRVGNDILPIKANDLIIVNPHVEHTETGSPDTPLEYIVLGIDGVDFHFENEGQNSYRKFSNSAGVPEMTFFLETMVREAEGRAANYEAICQGILDAFLAKLTQVEAISFTPSSGKRSSRECAIVKRYIDNNYQENITLDSLAEMTHVSKYYLVHSFHRENGISPITYLIKRRIRESKYLLQNTDYTLSQIAQMLGFSSQSYFSQSFKRQELVSPKEYRKRSKRGEPDLEL